MLILYTPSTGFPDLEIKIAYGLARVGIEAFGMEKVAIHDEGGFYAFVIDVGENKLGKLDKTFNPICRRLLSSYLFLIPIENYLDFIRHTPYNIATLDVILRRKAYGSLQELNNAIYNRKIASLSKFTRLYVQKTSTTNFTNLLYPETAKYLLKE